MPHRLFSPPPRLSSFPPADPLSPQSIPDESPEDPFSAQSDGPASKEEEEAAPHKTVRDSTSLQSPIRDASAMPANPFKRTLASLSTESIPSPSGQDSEGSPVGLGSKTTRPHYDVEDFKKLLLTGEKSASGTNTAVPPPVSFQNPAHIGDSSSNTDASSISRQSIFEPASGPLHESPRTSHDSVLSDDERQRLVGVMAIASEKTKPLTPKHRHGKLVKTNAPQTVSFEDPTLSFSKSALTTMAPVDRSNPETSGNADKPLSALPSPPSVKSSMQNLTKNSDHDMQYSDLDSGGVSASDAAEKRSPPPPPLSRRHSQLKAKHFSGPSERTVPIAEEAGPEPTLPSQSVSSTSIKGPPPPPPRRAGLHLGNSSSSISTGASLVSVSDQSSAGDITHPRSAKPRPAVPANQNPSVSTVKRPDQAQSTPEASSIASSSSSPPPPPPPPPRRRGSSQSSYTPSRLSGHYTERLRSDSGASSISHLAMTPESSSTGAGNKDVMADLSALQREVDELRGKLRD